MPKFEPKFTDDDFLGVLDTEIPATVLYIMQKLGCSRNTANAYIEKLEQARKVKKVEIRGARYDAWVRLEVPDGSE